MATRTIRCPSCQRPMNVTVHTAAQDVQCPECYHLFSVPAFHGQVYADPRLNQLSPEQVDESKHNKTQRRILWILGGIIFTMLFLAVIGVSFGIYWWLSYGRNTDWTTEQEPIEIESFSDLKDRSILKE